MPGHSERTSAKGFAVNDRNLAIARTLLAATLGIAALAGAGCSVVDVQPGPALPRAGWALLPVMNLAEMPAEALVKATRWSRWSYTRTRAPACPGSIPDRLPFKSWTRSPKGVREY